MGLDGAPVKFLTLFFLGPPTPSPSESFNVLMNQPCHQWVTRLRKVVRASIDRAGLQSGWSEYSSQTEFLNQSWFTAWNSKANHHNKAFLADYHISRHLKISEVVCMLHGYYPLDISEGCWYCKQCQQALLNYTLYNLQWLRDLTKQTWQYAKHSRVL